MYQRNFVVVSGIILFLKKKHEIGKLFFYGLLTYYVPTSLCKSQIYKKGLVSIDGRINLQQLKTY